MAAGKALSAFHDSIWVTAAAQVHVHLTVWETTVEEVWSGPEGRRGEAKDTFRIQCTRTISCNNETHTAYLPTASLMTLVKTPLRTRVRVIAGSQEETQLNHEKDKWTWRVQQQTGVKYDKRCFFFYPGRLPLDRRVPIYSERWKPGLQSEGWKQRHSDTQTQEPTIIELAFKQKPPVSDQCKHTLTNIRDVGTWSLSTRRNLYSHISSGWISR